MSTLSSPDRDDTDPLSPLAELYEDDSIGDDTEGHQIIVDNGDNCISRFITSNNCTGSLYILLSIIALGSIIGLVFTVVAVVFPFQAVHSFINGTCIPSELVVQDGKTCMCGPGCTAKYHCLIIIVIYQDTNKEWRNATLYENESDIGKEVNLSNNTKNI